MAIWPVGQLPADPLFFQGPLMYRLNKKNNEFLIFGYHFMFDLIGTVKRFRFKESNIHGRG